MQRTDPERVTIAPAAAGTAVAAVGFRSLPAAIDLATGAPRGPHLPGNARRRLDPEILSEVGPRIRPLGLAAESRFVVAGPEYLADHDLDGCREWDSHERPDHPKERTSKQDRDEHHEWLHVDGPRLNSRLDDVVLDLLIDDRPDRPDDRG
jgi:hypothetical protein